MLNRKESPTKRPSMPKVGIKSNTLSQRNGFPANSGDASIPKTRFTLTDGSNSSPRLRSFPVEKIKRVEFSPSRNFSECVEMLRPTVNNGQGDTLEQASVQFHLDPRPEIIRNPNISSISEQQVPRPLYPLSNQVNHSEVIPSAMENCSMERASHRPFVPNIPRTNLTLPDNSQIEATKPPLVGPSQTIHPSQLSRTVKSAAQISQHDPWTVKNNLQKPMMDLGNKFVEDRYAADHRRSIETRGNEYMPESIQPMRPIIRDPNVSNLCPLTNSGGWTNSPNVYHPHQPKMIRYYNDNNSVKMPRTRIIEAYRGMTSPQDAAVNHVKNYQRIMQHDPHGWTQSRYNSCIQNQQAEIQPYLTTPCINVTPDSHVHYHYQQHGTQVPDSHGHASANCPQQQQQFRHPGELLPMTPNQSINVKNKLASENSHKRGNMKKNPLRYSQAMMQDQEMLVTTMRQQGIPEDIMKRQFDALLAEQRKQLLYLEQLELGDSNSNEKLQPRRRVQRKISRIEEDGKPEWMLHITPPRIPYSTIDKMAYGKEVNLQQTAPNNGNVLRDRGIDDPQGIQANLSNYQQHTNNFENWQRQGRPAYLCHNSNIPKQHQGFEVSSTSTSDNGHNMYCGYQIEYPHQQQFYGQQTQEKLQLQRQDTSNPREELEQTKGYDQPTDRKIEPSSLFKLRQYKEVVRRRKQNNGLQDSESVKEAMEALKNPANRRGLEYLENLNKKRDKPLSLNGAQDPHENVPISNEPRQQYISLNYQQAKMPSANGLENHRNPNNPRPSTNLRQRKLENSHFNEYPRQRTCNVSRDCCSLMAERENGTVANSLTKEYRQRAATTIENPIGAFQHMQSKSENNFQFSEQMQQNAVYKDQQIMATRNPSMPLASNWQNQPTLHGAPIEHCYENRDKYDPDNPPLTMNDSTKFADGVSADRINADFHQQHCYPQRNNDLHETITIGGIKYLARKREYIPNSSMVTSHHNQTNPGTYFNPMISCQ